MKRINYPKNTDWKAILERPQLESASLESIVQNIFDEVQQKGDEALRAYTLKFDGVSIQDILVSKEEFENASKTVSNELKDAMKLAATNIETFHRAQIEVGSRIDTMEGVSCWRKSVGIEKVGLYIPGGSAPLFSTVLMLGIPAKVAGCAEVVLCSPPDKQGNINPAILVAAQMVGVTKVFKVGGVQAIAAMTYGTSTIPAVYKIFGPGNQYVTSAKQYASNKGVAIDMPAGPSEVAVLADKTCVPDFVAADLLSQAEHGADSQVVLVSDSSVVIENVLKCVYEQLERLPRKAIAEKALENSKAILVSSTLEGLDLLNIYAPEHLIIACAYNDDFLMKIKNAGSVFLGNYSCESAGDYASGTNHTLPTNGNARAYSGVSLDSFIKKITFQELGVNGLQQLGKAIETMAEAEGLLAHKEAVSIRLKTIK